MQDSLPMGWTAIETEFLINKEITYPAGMVVCRITDGKYDYIKANWVKWVNT